MGVACVRMRACVQEGDVGLRTRVRMLERVRVRVRVSLVRVLGVRACAMRACVCVRACKVGARACVRMLERLRERERVSLVRVRCVRACACVRACVQGAKELWGTIPRRTGSVPVVPVCAGGLADKVVQLTGQWCLGTLLRVQRGRRSEGRGF